VDEIAVAGDLASDTTPEVRNTVESLLDGFHREIGVAAVRDLEESDLGVAGKIDILGTVSYEL
jgi:hypothetical protein